MVTASACYKLAAQRRIGGVDPDGSFKNAIRHIYPDLKDKEYRSLEKFADLGTEHIHRIIMDNDELDIKSLMK